MGGNLISTSKHFAAMAVVLSVFSFLPETTSAQNNGVPVMIGAEADYDACGSTGQVYRLNPDGDNFLAVRSGPSSKQRMIDKLHTGDLVYMCDSQGQWVGIVYSTGNQECGVSSPVPVKQPYDGVCASGWVHERYIRLVAG